MGKFKRELTYTGDTSKLTNIQKKRVSSVSQESDTITWLGYKEDERSFWF